MPEPDTEAIHCPQCGYDLRAIEKGRCPECGFGYEKNAIRLDDATWYDDRLHELRYAARFGIGLVALSGYWLVMEWTEPFRFHPLLRPPRQLAIGVLLIVFAFFRRPRVDVYERTEDGFHFVRNFVLGFGCVGLLLMIFLTMGWEWRYFWAVFPFSYLPLMYLAIANYHDGLRLGRNASLDDVAQAELRKWKYINWYLVGVSAAVGALAIVFWKA